jgi:hypothetical protein
VVTAPKTLVGRFDSQVVAGSFRTEAFYVRLQRATHLELLTMRKLATRYPAPTEPQVAIAYCGDPATRVVCVALLLSLLVLAVRIAVSL